VTALTPKSADFAERVRRSFARQSFMETIGAALTKVEPGHVEIILPVAAHLCQQHGFVHAGVVSTIADDACGYAALTLMPAGAAVLTVEFKANFLAPAAGERLIASAKVVKPGRTLVVALAEVQAEGGGERRLVSIMTATLMTIEGRDGFAD
jgi:uncharacterized protein (TIGR00369 family)